MSDLIEKEKNAKSEKDYLNQSDYNKAFGGFFYNRNFFANRCVNNICVMYENLTILDNFITSVINEIATFHCTSYCLFTDHFQL